MYGTLLGIIREGKLIDHDNDVDIMVHKDDFNKACKLLEDELDIKFDKSRGNIYVGESSKGQVEIYSFKVSDGKVTDMWEGDILGKSNRSWDKDLFFPTKTRYVEHLDLHVKIPNQPENILELIYRNWKVLNKENNGHK